MTKLSASDWRAKSTGRWCLTRLQSRRHTAAPMELDWSTFLQEWKQTRTNLTLQETRATLADGAVLGKVETKDINGGAEHVAEDDEAVALDLRNTKTGFDSRKERLSWRRSASGISEHLPRVLPPSGMADTDDATRLNCDAQPPRAVIVAPRENKPWRCARQETPDPCWWKKR